MSRAFIIIAVILSFLFVTSIRVQASPVMINEVVQVISSLQSPPDLRLSGSVTSSGSNVDPATSAKAVASPGSLFEGLGVNFQDPQKGVEVVVEGEVDGTICDCGDIWVEGGFPRWPLIFLAGIPFIFIDSDDLPPLTPEPPSSMPTPTPPTPTPEPGSLLLLGTSLVAFGAGLRRRHTRAKLAAQNQRLGEGRVS